MVPGDTETGLILDLMLPADAPLAPVRGRARLIRWIWHDTADFALAADGLALIQTGGSAWRVDRFRPATSQSAWAPGAPDWTLAEGDSPAGACAAAGLDLPDMLIPMVRLQANERSLRAGPDGVTGYVIAGVLHGAASERPVRLLRLAGPAFAVIVRAEELGASVPGRAVSAQALGLVYPDLPPRRSGAPDISAHASVGMAVGHIVGHLADVILDLAPSIALGVGQEPVHQMRVATRRLRSALGLFGKIAACPELAPIKADARRLAAILGPARDWDVFLAGTGAAVVAALPDDAAMARLLGAAKRRRQAAYRALRAYLDGPEFRRLGLRLAEFVALRPWEMDAAAAALAAFAARALKKRHGRMVAAGDGIASLDVPALHRVRLQAKGLRYAAEFLAPAFPDRSIGRYVRRLSNVQEALGHLNDANVAAGLMGELAGAGGLGYAGGVVRGFVAGSAGDARADIAGAWKRFRKLGVKSLFAAREDDLKKD
jgi:triphosphatase